MLALKKLKLLKHCVKLFLILNFTDAKKVVEEAPAVIAESASKADAEKMKKKLEAAGAKVELS